MRVLPVVMGLGLLCALVTTAAAADEGPPRLDRVVITGNQRVEEEAIRVQLRSQPGTRMNEETVDNDIRAFELVSNRRLSVQDDQLMPGIDRLNNILPPRLFPTGWRGQKENFQPVWLSGQRTSLLTRMWL